MFIQEAMWLLLTVDIDYCVLVCLINFLIFHPGSGFGIKASNIKKLNLCSGNYYGFLHHIPETLVHKRSLQKLNSLTVQTLF